MNAPLSRRSALLTGLTLAAAPPSPASTLTAADVIARIQHNIGIPWRERTVDKLVAGSPGLPVKGIATTMMATLEVLEHAASAGTNLVITHETPFYLHQDQTADLAGDPTYNFKLNFIREHSLAVFHFHDHWHARKPDGIAIGMQHALGWTDYAAAEDPRRFTFPAIPLSRLARQMQSRLHARAIRVVGHPDLPIRHALASWGYVSRMPGIPQFRDPNVDLFIAGETREWELVEYVQDSITKGGKKALILLGHIISEQAGMTYCAEWLRAFIPEVPIRFFPASEPFWLPNHPVIPT